jgi:hypothetical protein
MEKLPERQRMEPHRQYKAKATPARSWHRSRALQRDLSGNSTSRRCWMKPSAISSGLNDKEDAWRRRSRLWPEASSSRLCSSIPTVLARAYERALRAFDERTNDPTDMVLLCSCAFQARRSCDFTRRSHVCRPARRHLLVAHSETRQSLRSRSTCQHGSERMTARLRGHEPRENRGQQFNLS